MFDKDSTELLGRVGLGKCKDATAKESRPEVWKVCLVVSLPVWPVSPASFLDVLLGWVHTWLWNEIKVIGCIDWLSQVIAGGTLVAVTDSSYIREHYP